MSDQPKHLMKLFSWMCVTKKIHFTSPPVLTVPTTIESHDSVINNEDEDEGFLLIMDSDDETPSFDFDGFAVQYENVVISPSKAINHSFDILNIPPELNDRVENLVSSILNNENLNSDQRDSAISLIVKYADVFGTSYKHLKQTDLLEFHVDRGNAKPVYQKPFSKFSYSELDTLKEELKKMVDNGVLIPHIYDKFEGNEWSFQCRYVKKKDGGKQLVTQFMKLNDVTVRDPWPIPSLKNTIEEIGPSFGHLMLIC